MYKKLHYAQNKNARIILQIIGGGNMFGRNKKANEKTTRDCSNCGSSRTTKDSCKSSKSSSKSTKRSSK